jgi:hypothetical protein
MLAIDDRTTWFSRFPICSQAAHIFWFALAGFWFALGLIWRQGLICLSGRHFVAASFKINKQSFFPGKRL